MISASGIVTNGRSFIRGCGSVNSGVEIMISPPLASSPCNKSISIVRSVYSNWPLSETEVLDVRPKARSMSCVCFNNSCGDNAVCMATQIFTYS